MLRKYSVECKWIRIAKEVLALKDGFRHCSGMSKSEARDVLREFGIKQKEAWVLHQSRKSSLCRVRSDNAQETALFGGVDCDVTDLLVLGKE